MLIQQNAFVEINEYWKRSVTNDANKNAQSAKVALVIHSFREGPALHGGGASKRDKKVTLLNRSG